MKSQITIKKIQELLIKGVQTIYVDDDTSRRMWWASLEVIQRDFLSQNYKQGGIWVASPLPAFSDKKFLNQLHGWLWSPEGFPYFQNDNAGFLPVNNADKIKKDFDLVSNYKVLNLSQEDGYEPFLMIITPNFQCILSIAGEKDKKILLMKCDEESLKLSIELMHEKLLNWKINGELKVPVFDKSLRNGLGDRSHWRLENPDLLILEGWFLGIKPYSIDMNDRPINTTNLSLHESSYVLKIQNNLNEYLDIWTLIDSIWHLQPLKIAYMTIWNTNQVKEMFLQKGNALKDEKLSNFLRMLNVSIPHTSYDEIKSYALLLIDQERKLVEARLNF